MKTVRDLRELRDRGISSRVVDAERWKKALTDAVIMLDLDNDHFGAVLNCAVRYCLGRQTYMPGLVTDWIMGNCAGILNEKTLAVMIRDIDEYAQKYSLGDDCDVRQWQKFGVWLIEQRTEVKE